MSSALGSFAASSSQQRNFTSAGLVSVARIPEAEVVGESVVATAFLSHLLHHAVVVEIEDSSYRLRQHADLMPGHLRSKALFM